MPIKPCSMSQHIAQHFLWHLKCGWRGAGGFSKIFSLASFAKVGACVDALYSDESYILTIDSHIAMSGHHLRNYENFIKSIGGTLQLVCAKSGADHPHIQKTRSAMCSTPTLVLNQQFRPTSASTPLWFLARHESSAILLVLQEIFKTH